MRCGNYATAFGDLVDGGYVRLGADRVGRAAGGAAGLPDQDDSERKVLAQAALEHLLVALLEDVEGQDLARKEDEVQREEGDSLRVGQ
jgi:hypothetical protein